jgi:PHD/YefM family antitoxin component YafN of YafNO toxin-antitoxin module
MVGDREAMTMERIELGPETELRDVVERVREDKAPRLIERGGVPLAVVVSPEQFEVAHEPTSKRRKERLLALAGVWSDLDADHMIEELYRRRGEAPPGRSVNGEARTENAT